ncbi:adenylate cyclase CyaB-like isoform X1 [Haliotis asinina]|uniref:adenylate cyclase CyaB-like isoform X1 n=2 Tax=Haliotis asinina TaxID=109174 RepID=UPI003531FC29
MTFKIMILSRVRIVSCFLNVSRQRSTSTKFTTMPVNVEIKAYIPDIKSLRETAEKLSDAGCTVLKQEDTFFVTPAGRLKLRQSQGKQAQLIYYKRSDQTGPKVSNYHVSVTDDAENLKITLGKAYGIKGTVRKTRYLYMVGQTRVHVDSVEGLGDFMELEVEMKPGQAMEEGQEIANDLMTKLGIKESDLIEGAYMDLILEKQNTNEN